eukprot:SAG31_NODE_1384_length_8578_cov_2.883359_5_plen_84_part_00
MGKPGGGPGPGAYEASIELGVSAGAPAYSLGASDKESLNKRYLSAGHQKALTKTGGTCDTVRTSRFLAFLCNKLSIRMRRCLF